MKLAVVEWIDSIGGNSWYDIDHVAKDKMHRIVSVGWVLSKDSESIHLLSSVATTMGKSGQDMNIPIGCVKRIRYVGSKYTIKA